MAGVMDKFKKKNKPVLQEWNKNGSFVNKPDRGWIHPDHTLDKEAGICYGVRYIGCIQIKESMKALDFETRTAVAREAINRVTEAAGLKTVSKKRKDKRIMKMLGDNPYMIHAGANVNLTVTVDNISLVVMESGQVIADHPMHVVSFASGGDAETLDFVAYVAKDPSQGRDCHVLECGDGLAEDVVTTIGQAFELRFKQHLRKKPKAVELPERDNCAFSEDKWGEEEEYYNDRPGARPPSPVVVKQPLPPTYSTPCNVPVGTYASVKDRSERSSAIYSEPREQHPLIDFSDLKDGVTYDNKAGLGLDAASRDLLDMDHDMENRQREELNVYDNKASVAPQAADSNALDPFDMSPFDGGLPESPQSAESADFKNAEQPPPTVSSAEPLVAPPTFEEWFHTDMSRKEAEQMLQQDGDFLVRESSNSPGQYVLSGRQQGHTKHLLLVDPDGIVRTKDFIFDSVSHLINYHRKNNIPIVTQGSEIMLRRPIKHCISAC